MNLYREIIEQIDQLNHVEQCHVIHCLKSNDMRSATYFLVHHAVMQLSHRDGSGASFTGEKFSMKRSKELLKRMHLKCDAFEFYLLLNRVWHEYHALTPDIIDLVSDEFYLHVATAQLLDREHKTLRFNRQYGFS